MPLEQNFISYAIAVQLGLQAWCLKEVVSLKVNVATITEEHKIMKKRLGLVALAIFVLPAFLLFTGCANTGDTLGKVLAAPGHLLNRAAQAVTETTTNVVTSVSSNGETVTQTNFTAVASAPVVRSIEGAKTITDWLPPQISGPASIALTGISALLALMVKRRQRELDNTNQQLNTSIDDAGKIYDQLAATIRGVERSVKDSLPVKQAIAKEAAKAGIGERLNETVQATVS